MNKGMYFAGIMAGTMFGHVLFDHVRKNDCLEGKVETQEIYQPQISQPYDSQSQGGFEIHSLESDYDIGIHTGENQIPVIMIYEE